MMMDISSALIEQREALEGKDIHRFLGERQNKIREKWEKSAFKPPVEKSRQTINVPVDPAILTSEFDLAHSILENMPKRVPRPMAFVIQSATAKVFGCEIYVMTAKSRFQKHTKPRQVAMYICHVKTGMSLPQIGRRFGDRDHTTVLHAIRKIGGLVKTDAALQEKINEVVRAVDEMDEKENRP